MGTSGGADALELLVAAVAALVAAVRVELVVCDAAAGMAVTSVLEPCDDPPQADSNMLVAIATSNGRNRIAPA